jgi:hypothetical protein
MCKTYYSWKGGITTLIVNNLKYNERSRSYCIIMNRPLTWHAFIGVTAVDYSYTCLIDHNTAIVWWVPLWQAT